MASDPIDDSPVEHGDTREEAETVSESMSSFSLKLLAASLILWSAMSTFTSVSTLQSDAYHRRRLTEASVGDSVPSYMKSLMTELTERKTLMEETPPEEVKYWFEYTGPLQVGCDGR